MFLSDIVSSNVSFPNIHKFCSASFSGQIPFSSFCVLTYFTSSVTILVLPLLFSSNSTINTLSKAFARRRVFSGPGLFFRQFLYPFLFCFYVSSANNNYYVFGTTFSKHEIIFQSHNLTILPESFITPLRNQ